MLNRLSSSTWQHITDPQSCSLYGFNVAFDRKKWISLENSLREIVKMIFSPWICGGLCREYWDLDLFVSSQKFCHFSALWLVLLFLFIWVFFTFCLPVYCKTIVCSDDEWFSEFFLTSPFVMWQVSWRIWEPYYVSDPLIANFVSFKEIRAAEIVFYWGTLYKFWLPPGMLGDWFCYY